MKDWQTIADIRREYGELSLDEGSIETSPIDQFKRWFNEVVIVEKIDPTAMVISTVDKNGYPDSRVVLLKGLIDERWIFYTNYQSNKGIQLSHSPYAALNFYWPEMARQVRVRGRVERITEAESDAYFHSRPFTSQLGAVVSPQSQHIESREKLIRAIEQQRLERGTGEIQRPAYWGGYQVISEELEFWQGRDNRLHDRIFYHKENGIWVHCRLAP